MIQPLSIVWDFNPVFFSIGSLDIRYYGLMWALAILIGAKFFDNFCKREGLPSKVSESIFIYGTLATILGARGPSSRVSATAAWPATAPPSAC